MKYPNTTQPSFYRDIDKIYKKYKIPKDKGSIESYCFPKSFKLQIPQEFLGEYINPKTPYRGLLVYHGIGSGKTCTAITICLHFAGKYPILVVLPASLMGNFRSELRSQCAGDKYISKKDRELLAKLDPTSFEYQEIIDKSDKAIDKDFTIYSYNKFSNLIKEGKKPNLDNTLMVIDEVHNMISEDGTYYKQLTDLVKNAPQTFRLVIMTATPIFDKPSELALTLNLLRRDVQLPTGRAFKEQYIETIQTKKGETYKAVNLDMIKSFAKGYVSYYRGAPPYTYPKARYHNVDVKMSDKQLKLYKKVLKKEVSSTKITDYAEGTIPTNFFIGVRMISNIVYPNNEVRELGYQSMKSRDYDEDKLKILSPKFLTLLKRLNKSKRTSFVYSNFKGYNGIAGIKAMLDAHGYKDYLVHGKGPKRYAIWSGDQKQRDRDNIKAVFNNINNADGKYIKVLLGSPSIKEGVSLLRVEDVHLVDPYWNVSRMMQIIGRGIRFCSHKDVKKEDRYVNVFYYRSTHPSIKVSIDEYIYMMAKNKKELNDSFELAIQEAAIDCELFHNANVYPGEKNIVCSKV